MRSARGRRAKTAPIVRQPPSSDIRCYLCARIVKAEDKVLRVHEATVHRHCYEEDIRRGR
jgi:hypothetical protein